MADRSISQRNTSYNGVTIKRAVVRNRMPEFVTAAQAKAQRAITEALIVGGAEASAMTPIHTGTLINSQFRYVTANGGRVTGRIGFTAEYAPPVHDPNHPQKFRRPGAEKEFLAKGFERAEGQIAALMRRRLGV